MLLAALRVAEGFCRVITLEAIRAFPFNPTNAAAAVESPAQVSLPADKEIFTFFEVGVDLFPIAGFQIYNVKRFFKQYYREVTANNKAKDGASKAPLTCRQPRRSVVESPDKLPYAKRF